MRFRFAAATVFYFLMTCNCEGQTPSCLSGKEGNIWYFGDSLGLNFNTAPPVVLTNNHVSTYEASTIFSDANGTLLFYSNGEQVWNRNHQVMPAVATVFTKLKGGESATHTIAVSHPGNSNQYYLFYPEPFSNLLINQPADTLRKMYYSIIDLSLNGGLGDVISKDNVLFVKTTEKVAVTQHCNGRDWWVLTAESGSNRYFSWLIDINGLANVPVISATGKINKPFGGAKAGSLKFSPNNQYLHKAVSAFQNISQPWSIDAYLELARFNNQTGQVSNSFTLVQNVRNVYGAEFSPDSRKLYFNAWTPRDSLYQYDLCIYDSTAIRSSKVNLGKSAGNTGQMLLGPDGKIYLTSYFRQYLSIIRYPNRKGLACQYEPASFPLPREALLGLPTFPASYYAPQRPYIVGASCAPLCSDTLVRYHIAGDCTAGSIYAWSVQGGTVVQQERDTAWVRWQAPGQGYVTVQRTTACGAAGGDTVWVEVRGGLHFRTAQTCLVTEIGTDTLFLKTILGCDSVVVTTTTLSPSFLTQRTAQTCLVAEIGTDTLFFKTILSCDSLIVTTTTLSPSFLTQRSAQTCLVAEVGTDTLFLKTILGCDSLVVTTTTLLPSFLTQRTAQTCLITEVGTDTLFLKTILGCDSLIVTTTTLSPSFLTQRSVQTCLVAQVGTDTLFFKTILGCDSLVVTTTILSPSFLTQKTAQTCLVTEVGTDTLFLKTILGCDSVVVTTSTLSPSFLTQRTAQTCLVTEVGTDTLFLKTILGCDSLIVTTTTLSPSFLTQRSVQTCLVAEVGTDTLFFKTILGCDSVVVITTTLSPSFLTQRSAQTCLAAEVGTDTLFFKTILGCDSVVVTTTTLSPSFLTQRSAQTCLVAEVGTDTLFFKTILGCDSLIVTTTTLSPSFLTQRSVQTCLVAEVGTDTLFFKTILGCDSLIVTTTTLSPSFLTQRSAQTCLVAEVGTDTLFFKTILGCDSLIVTTTTLWPSFLTQRSFQTCLVAEVGTDTLFFKTILGCDSLVVITIILSPSFLTQRSAQTCLVTEVGTDTLFLKTILGCDSVVVTTTTLSPSFLTQRSAQTCLVAEVGTDTLFFKTILGCDSLVVTTTILSPSFLTQKTAQTCLVAEVGTDTLFLKTTLSCDSLIVTTITLSPSSLTQKTAFMCAGEVYNFHGKELYAPGMYRDTLQTIAGCDSIVTLTLGAWSLPLPAISGDTILCFGEKTTLSTGVFQKYEWSNGAMGQIVEVAHSGTFSLTVTDVKGCQGIDAIQILQLPPLTAIWDTASPRCQDGADGFIEGVATGGAPPYQYRLNGGIATNTPEFGNLSADNYVVQINDAAGCSAEFAFMLKNPPALRVELGDAPPPMETNESYAIPLKINQNGSFHYIWSPPDGLSCTHCPEPVASPLQTTTYTLWLTDSNGCTAADSLTIRIKKGEGIYIPNVVSPNGTAQNQRFTVYADPSIVARVERLQVYDRWGGLVFDRAGFAGNDDAAGWDGTWRGQPVPPGVYAWQAEIRLTDGSLVRKSGDVTLVK